MSDHFKFRVYLPSLEKYVYFKELNSKKHLVLVKTLQNNDDFLATQHFRELITELCDNTIMYNQLTRVDVFCILLNLRIVCCSSTLKLRFKCDKTDKLYNIDLDLYDVLDKVTNYNQTYKETIQINDDLEIDLKIPTDMVYPSLEETILNCIESIHLFENTHNLCSYDSEQRKEILDNLPGNVLVNMMDILEKNHDNYEIVIFEQKNPHNDEQAVVEHKLNLYSDSFYQFIKLTYNESLSNTYQTRYIISKQLNIEISHLESITPAELDIYVRILEEEIEQAKKETEKMNRKNDGFNIPGMKPPNT